MSAHCEPVAGAGDVPGDVTLVLVGRPNAGKSSVYNHLTGGDAKVGNFPGVTVDVLESAIVHDGVRYRVVDLPGLYSLRAKGDTEEAVARRFFEGLRGATGAAVVVQVMDGSTPALGLRLTRELAAEGLPLVLAITRRDVLDAEGRSLDVAALEDALGARAVLVDARDARSRDAVLALVRDAAKSRSLPATSAREVDPDALGARCLRDTSAAPDAMRARQRTARLDRWLLHPWWGPLLFVLLMGALFSAVFLVADPASSVVDAAVRGLAGLIGPRIAHAGLRSFVVDGVLGGAGTVLTFLPQIVLLTVAMELLDASGYLARGVFLVDRLLRRFGLGGRSFVPLLTGHACAIPAIGATRIIRDPGERLAAILVIPLMTCSARIPTYGVLIKAFFDHRGVVVRAFLFIALYVAGLVAGLLASAVLQRRITRGRRLPLLLEMPAYQRPQARVVGRTAWRAAGRFVKDVGTTILVGSAILWVLLHVPMPARFDRAGDTSHLAPPAAAMQHSVAAGVGRALEPVTRAAGFDWRINIGLVASFGAREFMVGTLGVIFGIEDADDESVDQVATALREARDPAGRPRYTAAHGLALMAFFVIACQCVSTFAAIRRETRSWRWPLFTLVWTYAVGFGLAVLVFQVARALGG